VSAVVVVARLFPKEGATSRMLEALASAAAAIHAEPGCELYAAHSAPDGTIVIIEKWSSREALDAHLAGEPVKASRAARTDFEAAPPHVEVLTPAPAGDAARGAL